MSPNPEPPEEQIPDWRLHGSRSRRFGHRPAFSPLQRPTWWPENEPWPPPRGVFRHSPIFRRLGCVFAFFNFLVLAVFASVVLFFADALGIVHFANPSFKWNTPIAFLPFLFVAFVIIAIIIGISSLRRISAPLDDLLNAAGRVAEGNYAVYVEEKGSREIRALVRAFNNMAARLHSSDEQRRNLLADVTHELRTPLTVIRGNLEGMLDGIYPADEANLKSLLDETEVLSTLVEDLRTLALAESGALQLRREATDLEALIRDTSASFQAQADVGKIPLQFEPVGELPIINVDPGRIRQVLSNLMANALRYTPSGGSIVVRSRLNDGNVQFEVQDSGPGIPVEDLPHVFERFYKSTDSGGMGLGLAIARHLVEAHSGRIAAESSPGQGTCMRVSLPVTE